MPDGTTDHRPVPIGGVASPVGIGTEAPPAVEALGLEEHGLSQRTLAWRRFRRHRLAIASLIVLALIGLATALAPVIAPYGFSEQHLDQILQAPSSRHLLGNDALGRDELSRMLYGGRVSLLVGLGVAFSAGVLGTLIGAAAGYYGGRLDNIVMRVTDLFLSIPLLVVLIIASRAAGGGVLAIVVVLSLVLWMPLARIVRGLFLSLKEKEFVEAARAIGASNSRVIFRHLLPNTLGVIVVNVTLTVAQAILLESLLSFLGFGIQPPTPSWGNMLEDGRGLMTVAGWLVWFPGLAILLTVLCVNFLGDGLRDVLDPTQRRVRA
ncbi:MAG TPA: ABC transporter permease [Actinomycetes bacterium]|nr:ABC transporter permease [Actinomycetes bacterium]